MQNAVNHTIHPHNPTTRIRGNNPTGVAWSNRSELEVDGGHVTVAGLDIDTLTVNQAAALNSAERAAIKNAPHRLVTLDLRGHRASGHLSTVHRPNAATRASGPLLAMCAIATQEGGEHMLGQLFADFSAEAPHFLSHARASGCIAGRGIVTDTVARAALMGCALVVRDVPNGNRRREALLAGREALTAYIENYFEHWIHHGSANERNLNTALENVLAEHTTRLEAVTDNFALAAANAYTFPNDEHDPTIAPENKSNMTKAKIEVDRLAAANGLVALLRDAMSYGRNHPRAVTYQASVLGMFAGAIALYGANGAATHNRRSDRLGMLFSVVGAVGGFFPPAAAGIGLGVLVADTIRKFFTTRHLVHHTNVISAAYAFSDALELDEMNANATNTFSSILRTSLRLPA